MSDTHHVYAAINAVQSALAKAGITKDRKNQQQGYAFRGIDDIYNTLAGLLASNGLVILPTYSQRLVTERESKQGGALFGVTVLGEFRLVSAKDGSSTTVATYGEAMDSADKATNKAMSAAYKYACLQAFCIPTEGDNDADALTPEPVSGGRQPQEPRQNGSKPAKAAKPTPDLSDAPKAVAVPEKWQDCVIHFGKNKDKRLGDLDQRALGWYITEWHPKPFKGRISDADTVLRRMLDKAADEASGNEADQEPVPAGVTTGPEDDEIPGL